MHTLVLVHPFPLSAAVYEADREALRDRMRVLTPNMRGFDGEAPWNEGEVPTIDAMADDVAAHLDREGVRDRVVLGGHSMGGYVTLAFARRHPERLRGIVLADTRAEPDTEEQKKAREANIARAEEGDVGGLVDGLVDKLVGPDLAVRALVRSVALRQPPGALVGALRALRDRPDAHPGLSAIAVPALVLVGQDDAITPPSAAEMMHERIPSSKLVVIPHARHLSNLDQPEAFREAVASFVLAL